MSCGVLPDGSRGCLEACTSDSLPESGFACVEGSPVACGIAGAAYCSECGCPGGQRCEIGLGCVPLAAVGEACANDYDCVSENCSALGGVCRVNVGQPCTAQDCDRCLSTGDWSFCSRECTGSLCTSGEEVHICAAFGSGSFCYPSCPLSGLAKCPDGSPSSSGSYAGCVQLTRSMLEGGNRWVCPCESCTVLEPG